MGLHWGMAFRLSFILLFFFEVDGIPMVDGAWTGRRPFDRGRLHFAGIGLIECYTNKKADTDDDPTQNPWTFRAFFLGLALAAFGSSLATSKI